MPTFQSKPYAPGSGASTISAGYRRVLATHPFLVFGLPFVATILAGSFFLTPATAVRYERHDRKVRTLNAEEKLNIDEKQKLKKMKERHNPRDIREMYWDMMARQDKWDDYEPQRVQRLPGEPDGTFD